MARRIACQRYQELPGTCSQKFFGIKKQAAGSCCISLPWLPHSTAAPEPPSRHMSGPETPPDALGLRQESVTFGGLEEKTHVMGGDNKAK